MAGSKHPADPKRLIVGCELSKIPQGSLRSFSIAIEKNAICGEVVPEKMVMFHSYLRVPEGIVDDHNLWEVPLTCTKRRPLDASDRSSTLRQKLILQSSWAQGSDFPANIQKNERHDQSLNLES